MIYNPISKIHASNPNSLKEALKKVAGLRAEGVLQPITVSLEGGEYEFDEALVIDENVSAVTVEPIGNSEVIFSGGRIIRGFKETSYNGVRCFGAYIPEVRSGEWNFTDLYVDGLRADFTRYPEVGGFRKIGVENESTDLGASSSWMLVKKEDLEGISNIKDCILSFCHYWIDEHTPIKDYDSETGKLTFEYKTRFTISGDRGDMEYYLENVPQCFSKPNHWYLDRASGMVYYIPRSEEQTPENIIVRAPVISKILEIKGDAENNNKVKNIRFRGIKFTCTRGDYASGGGYASDPQAVSEAGGIVSLYGADNCAIEHCELTNYGLHGIVIEKGCSGIRIEHCTMYDGGAGGIKIYGAGLGNPEWSYVYGNKITDNIIKHCGRRYLSACGILIMHSYENEVSHNEISDLFYTGISCGWRWGYGDSVSHDNLITKNHIYNLGQGVLSDMGGIYLLGKQPGTVVSGNVIHDVKSLLYGGWALYPDEGSSYMTFEDNICYNCSDNCFHQHYGSMNVVRNNIFAFAGEAVCRISLAEEHMTAIFENNIMYNDIARIYRLKADHIDNKCYGAENNIVWSKAGSPVIMHESDGTPDYSFEYIQNHGLEEGSIIADPLFVDAENYNFTLRPESPALKMGFRSIDCSDAGVRK